VLSLSDEQAARGVVASSSGNHAAALSLAARVRGIPARIVMPTVALPAKVAAVRRSGGEIIWLSGEGEIPTSEEYERAVERVQADTGCAHVHPYDDVRTIAGQGTCALEFLQDCPGLEVILAPVGGGGLLAGTTIVARALQPTIKVIGCEPAGADDAQRSLRSGRLIPQSQPRTIADGLRTSLGNINFGIIAQQVDDIVTVSEEGIVAAMRLAWETLKVVIEPSSAVVLAAALERKVDLSERTRVGAILSGGNLDLDRLPWHRPNK
jgi:threonine dehydratase